MMSRYKALIDRLSEKQREVLGQIAMNCDGGHHPRTVQSLLNLGLIEAHKEKLSGFPLITVTRYSTPLPVHIAWCGWCSENVKDEDYASE